MEGLIGYLTARWDDEERMAQEALWAGDERWVVLPGQDQPFHRPWQVLDDRDYGVAQLGIGGAVDPEMLGRHIAYWDPARVLAEIAAKRRILEACTTDIGPDEEGMANTVLGLLVQPYADRPDFRPEWRL